ncbi:MAG: hypothetical protein BWX45_00479 [Deltaproteobacteria bacterium ADurb.Bin002]|nr:MAG: hypothetical protein BWX45_00479 [Deltaproteobacteria bacterium ADurb.Bin002]
MQKPQKQGRIPQRRQGAADITDQKDKKYNGMNLIHPPGVRSQDRPDEQHGRAGRADDRRQKRSDDQNHDIDGGGSLQRALDIDAACNREQRPQKQNKGDIVHDHNVADFIQSGFAEKINERNGKDNRPESGNLGKMAMPETGQNEGNERNRKQNTRKGQHRPQRQNGADIGGGPGGKTQIRGKNRRRAH